MVKEDLTKRLTSLRSYKLAESYRNDLTSLKYSHETNQSFYGKKYDNTDNEYLFRDEMGVLISPNRLFAIFKSILEQNKLRPIRFHDLRHTYASVLINKKVHMKEIQDWFRHSNYSTTANIYTHLEAGTKENISEIMQLTSIEF